MKALCYKMLLFIALSFLSIGNTLSQVNWTKYEGNPVFAGDFVWNIYLLTPCVLFNADSNRFEMWFSAIGWSPPYYLTEYRIGFAYSNDGISWTMHPDAVLTPSEGTWDSLAVEGPFVIRENGQYKMWYSSKTPNCKIGYATSLDGIAWTKYVGNPIFEAGTNAWENGGVHGCCVMPIAGGYKMWYTGYDTSTTHQSICYATSVDGILWQRDTLNNPVLEYGEMGEWDEKGIFFPRVLYLNNLYYMWFGGEDYIVDPFQLFELGLATSSDGIHWRKFESNPVLSPSPPGYSFDNAGIQSGSVILVGDTLRVWYDGFMEPTCGGKRDVSICLAESFFEVTPVDIPNTCPTDYVLMHNYPNPFNPSTTIGFGIQNKSNVKIIILNAIGEEVAVVLNEEREAGYHTVKFNAANLPSGVYFYQLKAGSFVETKKMLLLK